MNIKVDLTLTIQILDVSVHVESGSVGQLFFTLTSLKPPVPVLKTLKPFPLLLKGKIS